MSAVGHQVCIVPAGEAEVAAVTWRFRGQLRVTVVAKASFAFAPDATMMRVPPEPILREEVPYEHNPMRSCRLTSDLAPYLNRADVLFTGHAYPPPGVRVETMPVRLSLFEGQVPVLDKTLLVRQRGGFDRIPLVYERAFGGIDWPENPFGVGALDDGEEPSVFDPFDNKRLAGFGPIGRAWAARRKFLGATPRRVLEKPVAEVPDQFTWEYFQAAPPDQRVAFLSGEEWIVMDGLHALVPRLRMRLPGARGLACVFGLTPWGVTEGQPLALHADILRIDGDEELCSLTFRGVFPVAGEAALAAVVIVAGVELSGAPIPWPAASTLPRRKAPPAAALITPLSSGAIELSEADFVSVRGSVLLGTLPVEPGYEADLSRQPETPFQSPAAPLPEPALKTLEVPTYDVPPRRPPRATSVTLEDPPAAPPAAAREIALPVAAAPASVSAAASPSAAVPATPAVPFAVAPEPPARAAPPPVEKPREPASPWSTPPPPASPPEPRPPAPTPAVSTVKQGLYGRFGAKR